MRRVKGYLHHCGRCGLVHDTEGAPDAACRAWDGSLAGGAHGTISGLWDALTELVRAYR